MPTEAIRAWAPSCRSRSMRRTSAAEWSRLSARDSSTRSTRSSSRATREPPSMARSVSARARTSGGVTNHHATRAGPPSSSRSSHTSPAPLSARTSQVSGAVSSATGSSDIAKPPDAENHRKPTLRHRAGSRIQRTPLGEVA
ncbi:hypothetical protein G5V59_22235 [Nocardioides sp. W3-2-3]|nr:hypothetical protein [Nocardioides convexus]